MSTFEDHHGVCLRLVGLVHFDFGHCNDFVLAVAIEVHDVGGGNGSTGAIRSSLGSAKC